MAVTPDDVADRLGRDLTPAEVRQVPIWIADAVALIDARADRLGVTLNPVAMERIVALAVVSGLDASAAAQVGDTPHESPFASVVQTVLTVLIASLVTGGLTAPRVALSLGKAIGANQGFVYIRAEYPLAVDRLKIALTQAREAESPVGMAL